MSASREELVMMSAPAIARSYGVSTRTVGRWRRNAGVMLGPSPVKHPMSDRDRAGALMDDGASFAEAGRTVGVSANTVRRWFPDRAGWSKADAGAFARAVERIAS